MMSERSLALPPSAAPGGVQLYGESFVAPRWGDSRNAAAGDGGDEFLAFEYVYTRRR